MTTLLVETARAVLGEKRTKEERIRLAEAVRALFNDGLVTGEGSRVVRALVCLRMQAFAEAAGNITLGDPDDLEAVHIAVADGAAEGLEHREKQ